jgi:hypothetical protein
LPKTGGVFQRRSNFRRRRQHQCSKARAAKYYARPSAFQAFYHPESTYLEKTPTAQLTRIDAAERLFSVPLTRITSVPECAVSSVGFLWGSATVSQACGACVGLAEALICPAFPIHGARVPRLPEVTERHRSGLPAGVDSAPEDRITDRYHVLRSTRLSLAYPRVFTAKAALTPRVPVKNLRSGRTHERRAVNDPVALPLRLEHNLPPVPSRACMVSSCSCRHTRNDVR